MFEKILEKEISIQKAYKTEIVKTYTSFLLRFSEIFSDLVYGSVFDFAIYDSLNAYYDNESPLEIFNVFRNRKGIEINSGKAKNADIELALSIEAVEKLIQTKYKTEYVKLLGNFYNEPDEGKGWIDFKLHKRVQILLEMGYGRFAQTAGIIEY